MKKIKNLMMLLVSVAISCSFTANAQVGINTDGSDPDASAILDVKSTTKGFLPPRMTSSEMDAIPTPSEGLIVYNEDLDVLCIYNGSEWDCMDSQSLFNKTFFCGDNLRDFRDGQSYTTVQIGDQCWMAENLNIGTRIDGSGNQTDNSTIEKYCYNDSESNCNTYGGLYQWDEMMKYVTAESTQGVCPTGWHLPSDDEIKTLEMELGMTQSQADATEFRGTNEGSKMAGNAALWTDGYLENDTEFGTSGLAVIPAGYRNTSGSFLLQSYRIYLWSSSENGTSSWFRFVFNNDTDVYRSDYSKGYGFSVRCVRD